MKKPEIAKRLARHSGVTQGEAADRLDSVVRDILSRIRRGQDAPLPGLGRFRQGRDGTIMFERDGGGR